MRLLNTIRTTRIHIGSETITLRPSLRCAYFLACREGGYERLLKELSESSVTVIEAVLSAAAGDHAVQAFRKDINTRPLAKIIFDADKEFGLEPSTPPQSLNDRLIAFILALLDVNPENRTAVKLESRTVAVKPENRTVTPGKSNRQPQDFTGLLEHLFEIGTGWLGWTPEDTWSAAPAEIVAAHKGRIALLKAIFGSNEKETEQNEPDFTRDPDAGMKLRALTRAI